MAVVLARCLPNRTFLAEAHFVLNVLVGQLLVAGGLLRAVIMAHPPMARGNAQR